MRSYIGTKIINAEFEAKDGRPGYRVVYPDGYVSWSPAQTFENAYRPVADDERILLEHTNAENQVNAIDDAGPVCKVYGVQHRFVPKEPGVAACECGTALVEPGVFGTVPD